MSRLLQRLGCAVDTAANGQSAVEMIVASSEAMASPVGYDVVFLDNQMVRLLVRLFHEFADLIIFPHNLFTPRLHTFPSISIINYQKFHLDSILFSPSCPASKLLGNYGMPEGTTLWLV